MNESPEPSSVAKSDAEYKEGSCQACGNETVEEGYVAPFCSSCRTKLVYRPIPKFILAVAVISCILALVASVRFPYALRVAVAAERATQAEQRQDYASAEMQLLIVTKAYPGYDDGLVSLAKDSYNCGDYQVTADALGQLDGRDLDQTSIDEITTINNELNNLPATQSKGESK